MTSESDGAPKANNDDWNHLHPLSPILRGGVPFILVVGLVIANVQDRFLGMIFSGSEVSFGSLDELSDGYAQGLDLLIERNLILVAIVSVIGFIGLSVFLAWLSWRFLTYRITDDVVEARSGVIFRKHRRAPLDRIQSVNVRRSLIARVLGLAKLEILTASQSGTVVLSYLSYRDAQFVRERILSRVAHHLGAKPSPSHPPVVASANDGEQEGSAGATGVVLETHLSDILDADIETTGATAGHTLVSVPVGRLIASIVLNWPALFVALAVLGIVSIGPFLELNLFLSLVIVIPIGVGVMFSRLNRGFRFTFSRGSDAIRIGAGLTSTTTETIPLRRIHAVEARQPILWRPFGWWMVRITVAGYSSDQETQLSAKNLVLPVGTERDAIRVCAAIMPGVAETEDESVFFRDALVGQARGFLKAGPRSGWILLFGKRRAGIVLRPDSGEPAIHEALWIRRGALNRSLSIMPIVRVQSLELGTSAPHRLLGLVSLEARTVRGVVRMRMRGIARTPARELFDRLSADVLWAQQSEGRDEGTAEDFRRSRLD